MFKPGKKYYEGDHGFELEFIEQDRSGAFIFRVLNHPEWWEFETKVPSDIYNSKKDYLRDNKVEQLPLIE